MERLWAFTGTKLDRDDKESMRRYMRNLKRVAVEPFDDELEKTPEEIKMLGAVNRFLKAEFVQIGLPYVPFKKEQFHFFDKKGFDNNFSGSKNYAYRNTGTDFIVINKEAWHQSTLPVLFTHEAIRLREYRSFYANTEMRLVVEDRTGYRLRNPHESDHEHFYGLNDAVNEKLSRNIILQHMDQFNRITGLDLSEYLDEAFVREYDIDLQILDTIIEGVAAHFGYSQEDVWLRFKTCLFTGDLLYLRVIERTYGPGSARVLGAWESASVYGEDTSLDTQVLQYFQASNPKQRYAIALSILNERERLRYMQRIREQLNMRDFYDTHFQT